MGMTNEEAKEFIVQSVKDDVDIAKMADAIRVLEQPCEDCISREAVKNMLTEEWAKYMPMELDINLSFVLEKISELPSVTPTISKMEQVEDCISRDTVLRLVEQYPHIIGNRCVGLMADIKHLPSVTPKTSCESCREQVLKHLEKEDWADTVNCVMNMPFINKPCVSEGVCREDKMQTLDKIRAEIEALEEGITSYHNDRPWIFKDEALQIIDKYKAESEENADD